MKNPYRLPDPGIQKTKKEIEKQVTLEEYYKAVCELDELEEKYGLKKEPEKRKAESPGPLLISLTTATRKRKSASARKSTSGLQLCWVGPVLTDSM